MNTGKTTVLSVMLTATNAILRCKTEGRGFDSPMVSSEFLIDD